MSLDDWEMAKKEYVIDTFNRVAFQERTEDRLRKLEGLALVRHTDTMRDHVQSLVAKMKSDRLAMTTPPDTSWLSRFELRDGVLRRKRR